MTSISDTQPAELKDIPKVKEWPLIGSLIGMATDPARFFYNNYRKYGPCYRMTLLGKRYTVLAGPEAVALMSSKAGKDCLRSKEFWQGLIDEFNATRSLPGSDGEEHKELREILRRGYSKESIKGRYDKLIEITDDAIERDWKPGEKVPVVQAFQFMVTDQLGIMITGEAPLEYMFDIRTTILYILNCLVTRQRPKFMLLNPAYKKAKKRVFELGDKIKADYLAGKRAGGGAHTIVDDIMEANAGNNAAMPDGNLRMHLVAPYIAGLDTVANTLGDCIYTVLKHRDAYDRIIKEIDEYFASGPVEEQGLLKQLPLLNGAIMETMRMIPVGVALMRTASQDFVFEGHQIREGEMLYMGICVPHYMEEYYPNPEKFDIDRYGPDRNEHKQSVSYSPYGRGPHTCLGKSLAEVQLLLTMARIFYKLDMSLESPDYVLKTKTAPTPGPSMSFKIKVNGYRTPTVPPWSGEQSARDAAAA